MSVIRNLYITQWKESNEGMQMSVVPYNIVIQYMTQFHCTDEKNNSLYHRDHCSVKTIS